MLFIFQVIEGKLFMQISDKVVRPMILSYEDQQNNVDAAPEQMDLGFDDEMSDEEVGTFDNSLWYGC